MEMKNDIGLQKFNWIVFLPLFFCYCYSFWIYKRLSDFNVCLSMLISIFFLFHSDLNFSHESFKSYHSQQHEKINNQFFVLLKILIKYSASNWISIIQQKKANSTQHIVDAQYVATSWYLRIWIFIFDSFYSQ